MYRRLMVISFVILLVSACSSSKDPGTCPPDSTTTQMQPDKTRQRI